MANEPAVQEKEIKYTIDGREITLSPSLIRKYLVRGHGDLATGQEIALLMGICRARGLDPWAGDVYPIKYTANDPMGIITSIDFVRGRARSQPDCEGWDCGIIVQEKEGTVKDSAGLILEGEKLLGGWATCQPKGWARPVRLEVNLNAYIKKKSDGAITKFWKAEQQPMMISKVAEMQLLRRLWPASFAKLYLQEEMGIADMGDGPSIDMEPSGNGDAGAWGEKPEESISDKFERLAHENGILDVTELKKLLADSSKATRRTEDDLMAAACADFPKFLDIFNRSLKQKKEREEMEAKAAKAKKKAAEPKATATDQEENPIDRARRMKGAKQNQGATLESEWGGPGPFPEDPPAGAETIDPGTGEVLPGNGDNGFFVVCSDKNGDEMTKGYCRTACVKYKGHPVDCPDYQSESI